MVVDDSVVIRRLVTLPWSRINPSGRGTLRMESIGLQRVSQYNPDVITLDIEMPDMDGLRCCGAFGAITLNARHHVQHLTERGAAKTWRPCPSS